MLIGLLTPLILLSLGWNLLCLAGKVLKLMLFTKPGLLLTLIGFVVFACHYGLPGRA